MKESHLKPGFLTKHSCRTGDCLRLVVLLISIFGGSIVSAAQTTNFFLESAEGGAKSRLSWTFGADWLSAPGVQTNNMNYLGTFAAGAVDPSFSPASFAVGGAGSYNNTTTSTSFQITQLDFVLMNTSDLVVGLQKANTSVGVSTAGQFVSYTPGTDSYVVNIPFSKFIPGVYAFTNGVTSPANQQTLTITAVPEPSFGATALAGLTCGAYGLLRRRRSR